MRFLNGCRLNWTHAPSLPILAEVVRRVHCLTCQNPTCIQFLDGRNSIIPGDDKDNQFINWQFINSDKIKFDQMTSKDVELNGFNTT